MANRGDREQDVWLSDEQLAQLSRADEVDGLDLPVPTRMVSNGEHMPLAQTPGQKKVQARIYEMAEVAAKKLHVSRRTFLGSAAAMAASFVAMNEAYGYFFEASDREILDGAARAKSAPPADLFVVDDQMHLVRGSRPSPLELRAYAQGPSAAKFASAWARPGSEHMAPYAVPGQVDELGKAWEVLNPMMVDRPLMPDDCHMVNFIKEVFFDSQVTVGLLSNATLGVFPPGPDGRKPRNVDEAQQAVYLSAAQTTAVRDFVNSISGSKRMLAHGQLFPGKANLEFMDRQIRENRPDSWKGYTIATSAKVDSDPDSPMQHWRLDDEQVAYPTYELIARHKEQLKDRPGFFNICIHKGFAPQPVDTPEQGNPTDIPKAARDWPQFNFIIYHACFGGMTPFLWPKTNFDDLENGPKRNGVPDIPWLTQLGQTCGGLRNVYADIGSTFACCVISFPTLCAHVMGQLLKYFGEDRVAFGSDCTYYGSPQWQIEALWRFQIPAEMRHRYGYPELTERVKRKILGINSARLYGIPVTTSADIYRKVPAGYADSIPDSVKRMMEELGAKHASLEHPGARSDALAQARTEYQAAGGMPSYQRHGWVRT
jgi:predicted TIM-barrel fold metal-dependent hydrolase